MAQPMARNSQRPLLIEVAPPGVVVEGMGGASKRMNIANITVSLGIEALVANRSEPVLADNVSQGGAGGDQFRTAPLWGLSQRIFLLHDGRTTNLLSAIEAHEANGSEATQVELNFNSLSPGQQQDVLNFLRSL